MRKVRERVQLIQVRFIKLMISLNSLLQSKLSIIFFMQVINPQFIFKLIIVVLLTLMIPSRIIQILHFYMINVIETAKDQDIMIEDYVSLFWLGQINELIVDKTGCLTESEQKVTYIYSDLLLYDYQLHKNKGEFKISDRTKQLLFENICINSRGILMFQSDSDKNQYSGSRNERALLKLAYQFDYDYNKYRPSKRIRKNFPYQDGLRRMITIYQQDENTIRILYKGYNDLLLPFCTQILIQGHQYPIDEYKDKIEQQLKSFSDSMKIIVFAYQDKRYNEEELNELLKINSQDRLLYNQPLILIGIICLEDTIRPETPSVIKSLQKAQINVRIFSGDMLGVSIIAAKECGILSQDYEYDRNSIQVVEGSRFQEILKNKQFEFKSKRKPNPTQDFSSKIINLTQFQEKRDSRLFEFQGFFDYNNLGSILKDLKVLAKGQPKDKESLLYCLKLFDRVVCVTGDDPEQASAIEQAHIGIGLGGAEAKKSMRIANVVLLNDSIAGIKECISQGRAVFFAMSSLIQGYIYTSSILFLLTVYSALTKRSPQLMPLPSLIILSILLNQLSKLTLFLINDKIKTKVMKQGPYTVYDALFRETQRRQILYSLILFFMESSLVVFTGHMKELSMISSGVLILIHLEGISTRTQSILVKLVGIFFGLVMIGIQQVVAGEFQVIIQKWEVLLKYYLGCVLVVECNQFIVTKIKIKKSRNQRLSPKDSFVSK